MRVQSWNAWTGRDAGGPMTRQGAVRVPPPQRVRAMPARNTRQLCRQPLLTSAAPVRVARCIKATDFSRSDKIIS